MASLQCSPTDRGEDGQCGCATCAESTVTAGVWLGRRRILAGGAAALVAGASLVGPRSARAQSSLRPDEALQRLMEGNDRFVRSQLTSLRDDLAALRTATVSKQEPFAAVLSCADSRVPVELVFDQSIGRLFVTRVAGNMASPEVIASLEYGAEVLGARVIMVLGHEGCGAVAAALAGKPEPGQISALFAPLRAAVERAGPDPVAVCQANARIQADILSTASPVLADLIEHGSLKVVSGYYALATGKVSLL
jgi:carbonic anhydrase